MPSKQSHKEISGIQSKDEHISSLRALDALPATPHVTLLYHYFHPDDVVSARLFSDLAIELSTRGYGVTAMPSIRSCHDDKRTFMRREEWIGGAIERVWRPRWKQSSNKGRVGNAFFVLAGWSWKALRSPGHTADTVIVGTDPVLGVLAAIPWRLFRPRARIVHWCHDVYPQAAVADGLASQHSWIVRSLNWLLGIAYRRCDVIADLGPCMRQLLQESCSDAVDRYITVTPWSLVEPEHVATAEPEVRQSLFGGADLGMLYSGNLGRAHDFGAFVALARLMRDDSVSLCFAGRGARMDELRSVATNQDTNIQFADFAAESELERRLAAADIHLVSLRDEWTGAVVPSKFFGALAAGRPVLFAGSPRAAIARWIDEYRVGYLLTPENVPEVAKALRALSSNPAARGELNARCHRVYQEVFSKRQQVSKLVAAIDV